MSKLFAGGWTRWRGRAAIAVLTVAVLAGGGYLVAEYSGDDGDASEAAVVLPGPAPSGSDLASLGPALLPSANPSASAAPSPSASKSSKPAANKSSKPRTKGGFPGPHNTGVPAGTKLTKYTGPCNITKNGTVISAKQVSCDPLNIRARDVRITKSKVNGTVTTDQGTSYSFILEDSEVAAGMWEGPAVWSTNMTIRRSNIHGGITSVNCYANCDVRDSWLHGQLMPDNVPWHLGGFLANDTGKSGRSDVTLIHNTIVCDAEQNKADGGCSGNVNLFADFGPVSNVVVRNNFFGANRGISYCVYGGSSKGKAYESGVRDIVFEDNVFERGSNGKCGSYGPVTSFNPSAPGNRWAGNVWEDGKPVPSAN